MKWTPGFILKWDNLKSFHQLNFFLHFQIKIELQQRVKSTFARWNSKSANYITNIKILTCCSAGLASSMHSKGVFQKLPKGVVTLPRQKGERIIVHFHWQCPFEDWRPKFEHADVEMGRSTIGTFKLWHIQTSAIAMA